MKDNLSKKKNANDIKIIFTDIDWTILNHSNNKHRYDKKSIKALKKAQKNNVLVYMCTARPFDSVKRTGLFDLILPDGLITTNGAVAFCNDNLVRNDKYDNDVVKKVLKVCDKYQIVVEVSTEKDRFFTKEKNVWVDEYFKTFNETVPEVRKYNEENVSALLLFAPKELDANLKKELPKGLDMFRFTDFGIDLRVHPVKKSDGINDVLDYLNISKDNCLAIGDEIGDISMFEACKYSACMDNGHEEAKKFVTYICKHIKNHGVKDALKHFNII